MWMEEAWCYSSKQDRNRECQAYSASSSSLTRSNDKSADQVQMANIPLHQRNHRSSIDGMDMKGSLAIVRGWQKNRQVCLIIALCILEVNRQIEDLKKRGQALSPQYEIQLSIEVNDLEITFERLASICMSLHVWELSWRWDFFCHVAAESLILLKDVMKQTLPILLYNWCTHMDRYKGEAWNGNVTNTIQQKKKVINYTKILTTH